MCFQHLIPDVAMAKLVANGQLSAKGDASDPLPVVKLFTPDAGATWLLPELDPAQPNLALDLCDLGFGEPELGYVLLSNIAEVRGPLGVPIERDLHFYPDKPISGYVADARAAGRIIT